MKELRAAKDGALRVLFLFDPRRQAILPLGGDNSGAWNDCSDCAIPAADALYDAYLDEPQHEAPIFRRPTRHPSPHPPACAALPCLHVLRHTPPTPYRRPGTARRPPP